MSKTSPKALRADVDKCIECLKDKDKRIWKIEQKIKAIRDAFLIFVHVIAVGGSYFILGHAWCYIASNGQYGLTSFIGQLGKQWGSYDNTSRSYTYNIPYAINGDVGLVLAAIMIAMLSLLTVGWLTYFWLLCNRDCE